VNVVFLLFLSQNPLPLLGFCLRVILWKIVTFLAPALKCCELLRLSVCSSERKSSNYKISHSAISHSIHSLQITPELPLNSDILERIKIAFFEILQTVRCILIQLISDYIPSLPGLLVSLSLPVAGRECCRSECTNKKDVANLSSLGHIYN
jgi:hypothetical protein